MIKAQEEVRKLKHGTDASTDGLSMKFIRHIPTGLTYEVLKENDHGATLRGTKSGLVFDVSHKHLQEKGGFKEVEFINGEFIEIR